jgi:uncharacterized oxidoreductase
LLADIDLEGVPLMSVEAMVAAAVSGMQKDLLEICPGQSKQLRMMSRIAPAFIQKMLAKSTDKMLGSSPSEVGGRALSK